MKKHIEVILDTLVLHPKMATQTLAKMIYNRNPTMYKSVESVRAVIRHHRKELKRQVKSPISVRTQKEKKDSNGWNRLPKSEAVEYEPFILPKSCTNILCLSDIHLPYHDEDSLRLALDYGLDKKVNCVVLNGDIIDCYSISRFIKDIGKPDIGTELEMLTDFLRLLKENFKCPIYFKWGNHEERWEIYLRTKAPELLSISEFRLDVLCKFGELGIIEIKDKRIIKAGKLNILHGHELGRSVFSPVNAARGLFTRAKASAIMGHNHQVSEHTERDLNGHMITTWSQGCLCELQPQYMPINKWSHGFAHIRVKKSGNFEVDNKRIHDGRIL